MKWFDRWFISKSKWAWEHANTVNPQAGQAGLHSIDCSNVPEMDPVLTFRIYSAANGKIVEFRRYNQKIDRSDTSTYIVADGEDLGETIKSCLPIELLKVEK